MYTVYEFESVFVQYLVVWQQWRTRKEGRSLQISGCKWIGIYSWTSS